MTLPSEKGGNTIVPSHQITFTESFEVCWAGQNPLQPGLCFGSTDGEVLFTDLDGRPFMDPGKGSRSHEAINGLVRAGSWIVISSRSDVNFWPLPGTEGGHKAGWVFPYGTHGIGTTVDGHVIAPGGRNGIVVFESPFGSTSQPTALREKELYVYRVISLLAESGQEILACAARRGGIAAGEFSGPKPTTMRTATPGGLDVIDICPLNPLSKSLAVAALARDGSVILFRDILTDRNPITMKFKHVLGTAYRLLSHRDELYILTSKGLYVLGRLVSRFQAEELSGNIITQILSLPMDAVDMNLAMNFWILVVTPDSVRRLDGNWIHDNVPNAASESEGQPFRLVVSNPPWHWHESQLAVG